MFPDAPPPLVSVIIPCYNYGRFLAQALDSVRAQDHPAVEVVVVDDGSTDDTAAVAARYPEAVYVRQENQGLSAARNAGVRASRGAYLVFLDADDWLLPGALAANAAQLRQHPRAAFAAGTCAWAFADGRTASVALFRSAAPYRDLLARGNYIGMVAAVMFPRWVFDEFRFDVSLRNCEDYALYLGITRRHPVVLHGGAPLAAYRLHAGAMSAAAPAMLAGALRVLRRERPGLRDAAERAAFRQGERAWARWYGQRAYDALVDPAGPPAGPLARFLLHRAPLRLVRYALRRFFFFFVSSPR